MSDMSVSAGPIPFVRWADFLASWEWQQGEHVSVIGPTGTGKSVLMQQLLDTGKRSHVAVLGTKPRDATLDRLVRSKGYTRVTSWPPTRPRNSWGVPRSMPEGWDRRVILWPRFVQIDDDKRMAATFDQALRAMFVDQGWTINIDEAFYLAHQLGLAEHLKTLWTQGRSCGITVVAATQRPAFVPLDMYSAATHLFLFADNDEVNIRRVAGLVGLPPVQIRAIFAGLPKHSVLYVNTRARRLVVTRVE